MNVRLITEFAKAKAQKQILALLSKKKSDLQCQYLIRAIYEDNKW